MGIWNLYSKQRRRLAGQVPDVVTYDEFSTQFRAQLNFLLNDILGPIRSIAGPYSSLQDPFERVEAALCREYGILRLGESASSFENLHNFITHEDDVDRVLDVFQVAFSTAVSYAQQGFGTGGGISSAHEEINSRLNEHGLGYQFDNGEIIRTDSRLLHEKVVRPALQLLTDREFSGADEEIRQAFEHHRHGRDKDTLVWALKALESTLKIICKARRWPDTGQAKNLLDTVFDRQLVDPLWQSEFAGLRSLLESGVPTARNKLGGHGQGATLVEVPAHLAAFVLHQTAAAIVFLVGAHRARP